MAGHGCRATALCPHLQGLRVLCASSHHQAPADTPGGKREKTIAPFTRVVPGSSVGARSLSSFQHRSGTRSHLYSHRAAAGLYPPAVASHRAPRKCQDPASLEARDSPRAPSLHWQNAVVEGRRRNGRGKAEGVQRSSRRYRDTEEVSKDRS